MTDALLQSLVAHLQSAGPGPLDALAGRICIATPRADWPLPLLSLTAVDAEQVRAFSSTTTHVKVRSELHGLAVADLAAIDAAIVTRLDRQALTLAGHDRVLVRLIAPALRVLKADRQVGPLAMSGTIHGTLHSGSALAAPLATLLSGADVACTLAAESPTATYSGQFRFSRVELEVDADADLCRFSARFRSSGPVIESWPAA